MTLTTALINTALRLHSLGWAVLPVSGDGTKAPAVPWKAFQSQPPSTEQVLAWAQRHHGIGVLTGAVSGQAEMIELEGRAVAEGMDKQVAELMDDHGLGDVWARIDSGYRERTPSGGLHWLVRVTDAPARRNTKLARRRDPDTGAIEVLAETRGEGGFSVVAPSAGTTHPTGQAWVLEAGGPDTVATITGEERDRVHAIINMLDAMPVEQAEAPRPSGHDPADGPRPGDDFNARADWGDILEPHGWQRHCRIGGGWGWRRPGKKSPGISATTGTRGDGDNLFVFSTSTDLPCEVPLDKFGAHARLNHNGDLAAAARDLAAKGYGRQRPQISLVPAQVARPALSVVGGQQQALAAVAQPDQHPASADWSETWHANIILAHHAHQLRYVVERRQWIVWDGARWSWDGRHQEATRVREMSKDLMLRAIGPAGQHRRTLSAAGTTGALAMACTDPRVAIRLDDLDADPWALNTPGGIIDLRTGQLRPATPEDLCTRMTAAAPGPGDGAWLRFLASTHEDPELIAYLRRLAGLMAIGQVREHILPFMFGHGANGKSVFADSLMAALGTYAGSAPARFLMASSHDKHETEIARLAGLRLVVCSEIGDADRFDESKVKQLTGGDLLTARFMRADHFDFVPTHTLLLLGNHEPSVRSGGESFFRRIRKIPFDKTIPASERISGLAQKLATENSSEIIAWVVRGAAEYARMGLADPPIVLAATNDYRSSADTIEQWVEQRCRVGGSGDVKLSSAKAFADYEAFCRGLGEQPQTHRAFTQQLVGQHGVGHGRTNRGKFLTNIWLLSEDGGEAGGWHERG